MILENRFIFTIRINDTEQITYITRAKFNYMFHSEKEEGQLPMHFYKTYKCVLVTEPRSH